MRDDPAHGSLEKKLRHFGGALRLDLTAHSVEGTVPSLDLAAEVSRYRQG